MVFRGLMAARPPGFGGFSDLSLLGLVRDCSIRFGVRMGVRVL